jgi:hypothetical protein
LHQKAVFSLDLPFQNFGESKKKYWIGFCIYGGIGINNEGVRLNEQQILSEEIPNVNKVCSQNLDKESTISFLQPFNIKAVQSSKNQIQINWDEEEDIHL